MATMNNPKVADSDMGIDPLIAKRLACGVSQSEVARRLGLARITITKIELGCIRLTPERAARMSQAIDDAFLGNLFSALQYFGTGPGVGIPLNGDST